MSMYFYIYFRILIIKNHILILGKYFFNKIKYKVSILYTLKLVIRAINYIHLND